MTSSSTHAGSAEGLDIDTQVIGEKGVYTAKISPSWEIWGPNGGYMAAIAMRAAAKEANLPLPASFYCQFLRVARFDAVTANVQVVQNGRRSESIRVSLVQDDKPVLEGMLRTAVTGQGLEHEAYQAPPVPLPENLKSREELSWKLASRYPFWNNVEGRVTHPGYLVAERDPMPPHWLEWFRFRPRATFSDPFLDAARALVLIDTIGWPAVWLQHPSPRYLAPNLDVAAFFHAPLENSEWLLCEQESPVGRGGLVGIRSRIFDRKGRLVASGGAQLMCVPAPG